MHLWRLSMEINNDKENKNDFNNSELNDYVRKRIEEEKAKRTDSFVKLESFRIIGDLLILFVLGVFVTSPFIQLFLRLINGFDDQQLVVTSSYVRYYQWTIQNTHYMIRFTAVIVVIWLFIYRFLQRKYIKQNVVKIDLKELILRLIPLIVFGMLAVDIALVTVIRGPNEYDLTGHPYMFESIYSYISYPLVFFFCGTMLYHEKYRRFLIYSLIFTAIPINILALVNEWIIKFPYFKGKGVCAVFHNSNHYGYYLAITIISAALLFVYEKNIWLKVISAVSATIATMILIINNTLGAYLAVLFVLIVFAIYCFFIAKNNRIKALIILFSYLLITFVMSFKYKTIMSSFIVLFGDINMIIEDPLEADSAGSSRWRLWKGTIGHMGESPWLGFGVEGMLNTYHVGTPHNEFLQYAEFFGIPASLLYIIGCSMVLIRVLCNSKAMSNTTMICFFVSLCYLASSFFGVAIYYTTPFIYIFLGLTYAEYLKEGKKKSSVVEGNNKE